MPTTAITTSAFLAAAIASAEAASIHFGPNELRMRRIGHAAVTQSQLSLLPLYQMDAAHCFDVIVGHQPRNMLAVDRQGSKSNAAYTDKIVAGFRRRDRACPSHGDSLSPGELRRHTTI